MSNLATAEQLRRATSQLPVSWYCDPRVFDAEQRLLFANAPGYVGHELMVPNPGDYYALDWRDNAQVLVRSGERGFETDGGIAGLSHGRKRSLRGGGARESRTAGSLIPIVRTSSKPETPRNGAESARCPQH